MTDERDPGVSAAYRGLGAEEPRAAVDAAILAAARRRPRRSYAPLAAAAVLALAVGVTLHVQVEQPDLEAPAPRAQKEAQPAVQPSARPEAPARTTKRAEPKAFAPEPVAPAAPSSAPAPAASASGALAGLASERDARADRAAEATAKRPAAAALSFAETPERELERIAGLRAQGRQEEADRALAEFRKRYPDYRIPEEMRLRIERR